jgi:site-specific recombinase XerD
VVIELTQVRERAPQALVTSNRGGKPWTESTLLGAFKRTAKRAGVAGLRLHDARHYFVTSLFKGGTPAPAVQALAGHASLSTTQLYAHVGSTDLRAAVSRLGATLGQQRGNGSGGGSEEPS